MARKRIISPRRGGIEIFLPHDHMHLIDPEQADFLPVVASFLPRLGFLKSNNECHMLSSIHIGLLSGVPGRWTQIGLNVCLLAEAGGLLEHIKGEWRPTPKATGYCERIHGRVLWRIFSIVKMRNLMSEYSIAELASLHVTRKS